MGPLGTDHVEPSLTDGWPYSPVIQAAAHDYGIPADVLAGVVYMEVGGKPMWIDDAVDWGRQNGIIPGNPNDTSYGPLAVQVDTAAVALGYDPANLTDSQRTEIVASLKDPQPRRAGRCGDGRRRSGERERQVAMSIRTSPGRVAVMTVLSLLTIIGAFLAFRLWWLRWSDFLAGEPDAEAVLLAVALMTAAVALVELLVAGVAVAAKSVRTWWLAPPAVILAAALIGLCGVDLARV